MKKHEDELELRIRARETETISMRIPKDTLKALKKVAAKRDMSQHALIKLYLGQGLRHDLSALHADRVLETTAEVLARHVQSESEVSAILREIQAETAAV